MEVKEIQISKLYFTKLKNKFMTFAFEFEL